MGISSKFVLSDVNVGDLVEETASYFPDDGTGYVHVFGDQSITFVWEGREMDGDWWMPEYVASVRDVPAQSFDGSPSIRDHYVRMAPEELETTVAVLTKVLMSILKLSEGQEGKALDRCNYICETILQINEVLRAAERLPGTHIYYIAS